MSKNPQVPKDGPKPDISDALKMHQAGRFDAAQAAYEAVLAAHPAHADAENLLGVLHTQQARLPDAMARFARATELEPENADYWFNRGECARRLEQPGNAIDWYRTALRLRTQYKDAFSNLAALLAQSDRHEEFFKLLHDGLDTHPETTDHLVQIGQNLLAHKAIDAAGKLFEILHARQPGHRIVVRNLSAARLRQGRLDEALELLRDLARDHPDWPEAAHMLGVCFEELDQIDQAIAVLSHAHALAPERVDTTLALVRLHERRRDPAAARSILDDALEHSPKQARIWSRLAQHLERTSRLEEANDAALAALQIDAHDPAALTVLVQTAAREKNYALARDRVRDSQDIVRGSQAEIRFSHAAGRVCEATGEYEDAFDFYTRANTLARESPRAQRIKSHEHLSRLQASRQSFEASAPGFSTPTAARAARGSGPKAALAPIFLVGFPRSGTTLLERIISSGPNVHITDELPTMQRVVNRFYEITDSQYLTPQALDRLTTEDIEQLRSIYRDRVSSLVPRALEPDAILVDKNPMSIVDLPLITRLFPDSPILVLLRDPRDACLSCFTTEFTINRTTHLFSDMQDTVALYEAVMGLWFAYAPALGDRAMAIQYETLLINIDHQLPEIMSFCGIDPAEANVAGAESPAQNGDWVNTASYDSVVEPVHQRAIARWKHFEPFLGPAFALLTPYIDSTNGHLRTK